MRRDTFCYAVFLIRSLDAEVRGVLLRVTSQKNNIIVALAGINTIVKPTERSYPNNQNIIKYYYYALLFTFS